MEAEVATVEADTAAPPPTCDTVDLAKLKKEVLYEFTQTLGRHRADWVFTLASFTRSFKNCKALYKVAQKAQNMLRGAPQN